MKIISVIGSGYGDEGKGLSVDALSRVHKRSGEVTVVRVNGGAQAGHTVETDDGHRHVFHQFGAGSFAGAKTHWSRFFVATPKFVLSERDALNRMGARTDSVSADPELLISTPWDVLINQAIEDARGSGRHGSCGMGFGETIERSERGWGVRMKDVLGRNFVSDLLSLREGWVPKRLEEHGINPDSWADIALNDALLDDFLLDCENMLSVVKTVRDEDLPFADGGSGQIITEGAQGLGLDMDVGSFPHVTRSNTGLKNVIKLALTLNAEEVDAVYVTRAYATRHGAGPFPGETDVTAWADVIDPTNAPNEWQGSLRTGSLDLDLISQRIHRDEEASLMGGVTINRNLSVTCLDQLRGGARVTLGGDLMKTQNIVETASLALDASPILVSRAPSARGVKVCEDEGSTPSP